MSKKMKKYIGVKVIEATPMIYLDFCKEQSKECESNIEPMLDGFKVKYPDGYISWSPKEVFEEAYRETDGITFGLAIEALKKGMRVARAGWNGKGMFLYLDSSYMIKGQDTVQLKGNTYERLPSICMKTADNKWLTGWLASQTDMLADDWMILEG